MGGECAGSRAGTGRGAGEEGPLAGAAPAGRLERRRRRRRAGGAGRGGALGQGGRGWLGSGTQDSRPAQPASARPCQALLCHRPRVTALGAASRARPLRSSESTGRDEIFEKIKTQNRSPGVTVDNCNRPGLLSGVTSISIFFFLSLLPNSAPQFVSLGSGAYVRGSVRSWSTYLPTYTWQALTQRDPP